MINECKICGNPKIEANDMCASCNARQRKFERDSIKLEIKNQKKTAYKIPKISEKLKTALVEFAQKKIAHLKKHPDCQIKLVGCQNNRATNTVHHAAKRGVNLNKKEWFLTACEYCHHIVETKLSASERREKGLLITPKT